MVSGRKLFNSANSANSGWAASTWASSGMSIPGTPLGSYCMTGDFNGDGKTDIACHSSGSNWSIGFSTGTGWLAAPSGGLPLFSGGASPPGSVGSQCLSGYADRSGNIACYPGSGSWQYSKPHMPLTDLLTKVSNGIGGEIAVEYSSSPWANGYKSTLPFAGQFVSKVSVKDGTGNASSTDFSYSGGYYNFPEKDFRGFNYVKTINNQTGITTETWFHQGNDTAVDLNDPSSTAGFMKGRPYRARATENNSSLIYETETTYTALRSSPPYFAPPTQIDSYLCDGINTPSCSKTDARRTRIQYDYDSYGNITKESQYGDLSAPSSQSVNKTTTRSFSPNTASWIIGLPATETVYKGISTTDADKTSLTNYYYDNYSDCSSLPSAANNQTPAIGNLTRISRWLNSTPESYVETTTAYDSYGNPKCSRDPNGNITTIAYDGIYRTFPASTANAKGQTTGFSYYGVGTATDYGRFGQLKSVTDANGATISYEYDTFGRKTKETSADNFITRTAYKSFGTVGSQRIYSYNQLGMWSESYFDGLGRTIKSRRSGGASRVVAADLHYDQRGNLGSASLPYYEGVDTALNSSYTYDNKGRVTRADNPDATFTQKCYTDLITAYVDENGHKKRETKDPLGRLVKVEEFSGTFGSCDTIQGTIYATTNYSYDTAGNLTGVTNENGKATSITYDSLGRKKSITDPDMGFWQYGYYDDGTLKTVTDANYQTITYDIDELGRTRKKLYPASSGMTDVTFTYDETTSSNAKGRLTKMLDASGSTVYHYDKMGRNSTTVKQIDSTGYTITKSFDGMGRLNSVTYPDNETVTYEYDLGGNLTDVGNYAFYSGYNALGQPGSITYGNLATTNYWYYPKNSRLFALKTTAQDNSTLLYKNYNYDNRGNVSQINDLASPVIPQSAAAGSTGYTYWQNSAHRLQTASTDPGRTYLYDNKAPTIGVCP